MQLSRNYITWDYLSQCQVLRINSEEIPSHIRKFCIDEII